ncbi:MAG: DUF4783 domain-containing protein [Rhodothermales bacterium]|nr:DUF4783 domain-containing protein [Rhodothermales bacterium]
MRLRRTISLPAVFLAGVLFLSAGPGVSGTLAQTSDEALRELTRSFVTADAARLGGLFTPTVDLAILRSSRQYSRRQATLMMRSFFREHPPQSFRVTDFTKTGRGWFIEAVYGTNDRPAPFRVYVRLRLDDRGWLIRDIMIEEERE